MFYTFTSVLYQVYVQCPVWLFFVVLCIFQVCCSGIFWLPGITAGSMFHWHRIFIAKFVYLKIFSASILVTFLHPETAVSINGHVPCLLSWTIISGLLLLLLLLFSCLFQIYSCLLLGDDPLVILDLNKNSKQFTPLLYEWSAQCSLVWSVALWLMGRHHRRHHHHQKHHHSMWQAGGNTAAWLHRHSHVAISD